MPVDIAAFPIVSIEGMTGFKREHFGNTYLTHRRKDRVFSIQIFLEQPKTLSTIFAHFFLKLYMSQELFEQLEFQENPLFETIIDDLLEQQYSIVDAFFTASETTQLREHLLAKFEAERFKKSAIGNRTNEEIDKKVRGDYILWIDESRADTVEQLFFQKINALVDYLNRTCFLGILQKEFHYAVYPEGTFYKRHLDTFQNDDRRKLSVVCYLNEDPWPSENGGQLRMYLPDEEKDILPLSGRIVIFESQVLEHEVMEVKASERLSITGWLKTR